MPASSGYKICLLFLLHCDTFIVNDCLFIKFSRHVVHINVISEITTAFVSCIICLPPTLRFSDDDKRGSSLFLFGVQRIVLIKYILYTYTKLIRIVKYVRTMDDVLPHDVAETICSYLCRSEFPSRWIYQVCDKHKTKERNIVKS